MSFIPGEAAGSITNITTGTGSGIVAAATFGSANLTSGLVAGANVTLTPTSAFGGKGLRIDTTPGVSGVTSVDAGTGITLTGTAAQPIVNNAGVLTVSTGGSGSGITIGGTLQNPQISNAGVLGVTAGSGIALGGTAQNPQIANSGVLTVAGGTGITVGGTVQNRTINNAGVLALTAGTNVTITGTAQNPIINAAAGGGAPKVSSVVVSPISSPMPIASLAVGYTGLSLSAAILADFTAGTSPDPNGVWIIDLSPISLLIEQPAAGGGAFIDFGLGNSVDAGVYYPGAAGTMQARVYQPTAQPVYGGLNVSTFNGPSLSFKVSSVLAVCPSMATAPSRIYINNALGNSVWFQMMSLCTAYYMPNGFLA